ncbi:heparin lyase I family protein [Myxosarcina sp. GI1(2024)]
MSSDFLLVEAEDMVLENYRLETNKTHASGGGNISLRARRIGETGSASYQFSGVAGWYDLELGYFDEFDGISQLEIRVDDELITTINLDLDLDDDKDSTITAVNRKIASGLALEPGQTITITATEHEGEPARVDYLKFIPVEERVTSLDPLDERELEETAAKAQTKIVYPGATIFQSDFQSGLEGWKLSGFDNPASGIVANPDPNEQIDNSSVKFVLEEPDKREELNLSPVPYNSEITYQFRTFLPESYVEDPVADPEIVAQWHAKPDTHLGETWAGTGPVLSLLTDNGQWKLGRKWDTRQIIREKGQRGRLESEGSASYDLGDYQTGVWTDWTFHVKWSYEADGLVEVWQDNNLVLRETGPNAYNDELGPYLKIGLYNKKWQNPDITKRELYYDDVEVLSFEDDYLLRGEEENNIYVLNAQTAAGSQIQDTGGADTLFFSDNLSLDLAFLKRENNDLLLDIDRDDIYDAEELTISNFFASSEVGAGLIETVGNLDGTEIFNAFGSEVEAALAV